MLQPDLGSAVIMIVSAFVILFIAGYPLKFFRISWLWWNRCFYRADCRGTIPVGSYQIVYRSHGVIRLVRVSKGFSRCLPLRQVDWLVMVMAIAVRSIFICQNPKMISFFQLLQKNQDSLGQHWSCCYLLSYWHQLLESRSERKGDMHF